MSVPGVRCWGTYLIALSYSSYVAPWGGNALILSGCTNAQIELFHGCEGSHSFRHAPAAEIFQEF